MRNDALAHDRPGSSALREFFIGKGAASGCPFHRFNHRVVEDVKAVWGIGRQAFARREPMPEPFQKADGARADPFSMSVREQSISEPLLLLPSEGLSGAGFSIALLRAKMDDLNRQALLPDAPVCEAKPADRTDPSRRDAEPAEAHASDERIPASGSQASPACAEFIIPQRLPTGLIQLHHPPPLMSAPRGSPSLIPAPPRINPENAAPANNIASLPDSRLRRPYTVRTGITGASGMAGLAAIHPQRPETAPAPSGAPSSSPRRSALPLPAMRAAPATKPPKAKSIQDVQKTAAGMEPRKRSAWTKMEPRKTPPPKAPHSERTPKKAHKMPLAKHPHPKPARKRHQDRPEAPILRKPPASAKEGGILREKGKPPKTRHPEDASLKGIKGKKKIKNIRTPSRAPSGALAPP